MSLNIDNLELLIEDDIDFDCDENHEKERVRKERLAQSNKARAKRALIKEKKNRLHEGGFNGNI